MAAAAPDDGNGPSRQGYAWMVVPQRDDFTLMIIILKAYLECKNMKCYNFAVAVDGARKLLAP